MTPRKLRPEYVMRIRVSKCTTQELADRFGVSQQAISRIKRGHAYKLVPMPGVGV